MIWQFSREARDKASSVGHDISFVVTPWTLGLLLVDCCGAG